ncbi:hypothetical protein N7499_005264 [Penicillium canescens]|uniref:Uncharacterized protein n=1 Tax=Penicillium canescens TaxID=5083 RepID=A0AAD6N413_PENCN|nr:uncharacterized protein N7446_004238 [Penicillium canescens]KAJ6009328.1 hypothetical protein N7522_004344 [Penicillium canescens]KAJ6027161.1 hypothetical protein N7460_011978 [Penicillium canescens]KAJ6040443.1 hypothetical protein N7444_009348 [Penicillium canescens]KAJ6067201.1 hypothetical protein N7446_004238 [Penicillium canescens]KAJ6085635.1 hypothetical protein N7499_005264 [Penicillium canescens]
MSEPLTGNKNIETLDAQMKDCLSTFEAHPQYPGHPTIFFLYDFIRNTHNQLKGVDPAKFYAGDKASRDAVQEVIGRNGFAAMLTGDTTGKLAMLTGGDPANPADFGEDIKAKTKIMAGFD